MRCIPWLTSRAALPAAIVLAAGSAYAVGPLPLAGPLPADRYGGLALDRNMTSALTSAAAVSSEPQAPRIGDAAFEATLDAFYAGRVAEAVAARDAMPRASLEWRTATWAMALSDDRDLPAAIYEDALRHVGDWPAQSAILNAREAHALRTGGAEAVLRFGEPRTTEGALAVARHLAQTDPSRAARMLAPVWRTETLDAATERDILSFGATLLSNADHMERLRMLLYRDRVRGAERIATLAGADATPLVRAVGAVARRDGADAALGAVPERLRRDPLILYAKARFLRRADRGAEAARLLIEAGPFASGPDGGSWWDERQRLARQLLDRGEPDLAYGVAAGLTDGTAGDRIDAAFLAGWIALRHLDRADAARGHFAAILDVGSRSLSVSRGGYWLGRAEERLGNETAARSAFERAAGYPYTFYGQLAMERLNTGALSAAYPRPTPDDRTAFAARELVRAIDLLERGYQGWRATPIYRHLARTVPTAGEAALLTATAERVGRHRLSLQIGKTALARGLDAVALAFPVGAIPDDTPLSETGRALAYAIARQESGFDRAARSGAGALGLLQLMPATAKEVAGWLDIPYSKDRLTSDPGYNATLGARFLSRLLDRFDQSYVLAVAAYNAGPTRVIRWRDAYGDPVGASVNDVVDWIERVPFAETRNYIQRVMENYVVYRARLEGRRPAIERDLTVGRR